MANFSSVLDTPGTEIERPKPLPVGSYQGLVKGLYRLDKSAKKGTEFSEYTLQILAALQDVDEDALEAALTKPSGEKVKLGEKAVKVTFYHTPDALWRLKEFCEHCGVDTSEGTPRDWINQTPNCQVGFFIKHVPSEDGTTVYANVGKTFKVD